MVISDRYCSIGWRCINPRLQFDSHEISVSKYPTYDILSKTESWVVESENLPSVSEITPELSVMQDTEAPTIGSNVLASSTIPLMLFCAKAFIDNMRIRLIIICFFIFKIVQL